MDQRVSRPVRWRIAVNRATSALRGLKDLHREWAFKIQELHEELEELRAQRTRRSEELNDALADLVSLKSEYAIWVVPESLTDSRLQEKLYDVQDFDFQGLRDDIPELTKFALEDDLESALIDLESLDDLFDTPEGTLYEAKDFDLPKGPDPVTS